MSYKVAFKEKAFSESLYIDEQLKMTRKIELLNLYILMHIHH